MASSSHMQNASIRNATLFRRIKHWTIAKPTVLCHATPTCIHLEPTSPDGLPVSVYNSEGRQTVYIGGWYDDVDDDEVVLSLVEAAVLGQLRVRMEGDGRKFHTFTVEVETRIDEWIELGQMAKLWFNKKFARVVKYLRNRPPRLAGILEF